MVAVMTVVEPLFDSPRKALHFALNYHLALPRPQMNKMMADGKVQRIELADGTKITVAMPRASPRSAQLRGLDGAATAGMILQRLAELPEPQQLVLMASQMQATLPCSCKAPCCAGFRPNVDWTRCVYKLCVHLAEEAQLSKIKGKKGLSTLPAIRWALVEKYFVPKKRIVLAELAESNSITEQTVIKHRRPIITFLEKEERAGWRTFDELLSEAGIVGTML